MDINIREAEEDEFQLWNSFVDSEGGSFFHYYEWKYIYEVDKYKYIPLLLEDEQSQLIGIIPLIKIKGFMFSSLVSVPEGSWGGFLFKRDLINGEKDNAIRKTLKYIDKNYSKSVCEFVLKENISMKAGCNDNVLADNGFRYDGNADLPCSHILKLSKSFEKDIWNALWKKNLKKAVRIAKELGVISIIDEDLTYFEDVFEMLAITFKRFHNTPMSKEELKKRLTLFKNKTKLFIALHDDKPIAAIICHYTPSICYFSKIPSYEGSNEINANKFLLSEAIKNACNAGYNYFEFGVSSTPSLASWKDRFRGKKFLSEFIRRSTRSLGQ